MDRISAIEKSLTVFVCGLIGFLPVVGLLPAVHALVCSVRVRSQYGGQWNPASAYLRAGTALATFGVLSSILVIAVVSLAIANAF
ncbi:MAG TPA: hypothetical protein VNZ64_01265 [Candidatus Acidoferrum sp.]|jgi:hypothetical protein|nr:hypothetical protein [Candidatus Acidoferrum sp.]